MTPTSSSFREAIAPLWRDNMALAQLLGLCPLLAVTTTAVNGLALGLASAAVVVIASTTMAALKRALKPAAQLPIALLILAALVTVVDLFTEAVFYDLHGKLGIFIPLIVVNSGLLAHAENVAGRRSVGFTFLSAVATGLGFLLAFVALGAFREIVGHGTLLSDIDLLAGEGYRGLTLELPVGGMLVAILPPGAFFGMGLLLALRNRLTATRTRDDRSSSGTPR
ncbi:MAG TPA: electron transport complex subunit RsxE [Gammaproteobacteria bacterium]|nr:electron transport complex subunit RsxE [Gammaproteobacteria bacterium]